MGLGAALSPSWTVNGLSLTTYPFSVPFDGPDYGTPDVAVDTLISFLTRGDLEHTSHTGNRTLTLPVDIEGSNLSALADAEALLKAAVDVEFGELLVDPGDGVAPSFKFNIFRGVMAFQRLDAWEMSGIRRFTLTFRAEPDVYSAVLTTVAALAASGSTTTNVDAGSSTTGWTAKVNGSAVSPSTSGGAVVATSATALDAGATIVMTRTGTIATSATKYLVVDWKIGAGCLPTTLTATGDGTPLTVLASQASPTAGYTRTWFSVAASSVTTLALSAVTVNTVPNGTPVVRSLSIDNIDRTDVRPGSARMQVRTLPIGGSAPTTGSLSVQHATTSLGDVIVYTCTDDGGAYVPWCRAAYRTAGGSVTSDATALSGGYDTLSSPVTFTVPVAALPDGEYVVMARTQAAVINSFPVVTVASAATVNGTSVGAGPSLTLSIPNAPTAWTFFRLGMLHLPVMDLVTNPTSAITLTVSATTALRLDDLFLFNVTTGRLTQVSCGTATAASGGPANRLWIDSPSLDNNGFGRYLMGFAADRSDAYSAYPAATNGAIGIHEFPGGKSLKVCVVTSNLTTTGADVAFTYYAAHANHAS